MPISSRRQARILAYQTLYQRKKIGIHPTGEELLFNDNPLAEKYSDFCHQLIETTWKELATVDETIQRHLTNWRQARISDSLNALLRIATSELLFFPDIDGKVVLNEAIEICRNYVDAQATKILNGVLHAIWQEKSTPLPAEDTLPPETAS
ncbi:MAG: transcription antitermination factor NusB [Deltaproteobacteria bacterium]|jgi:transcription antitermination protein NusB|nr:transcription antitermination factor NusB [Deltaproteobacteria bacterium]MBT4263199.1 transcription antitermination factor NusB [Deltaproteobacteria bacterium]MBT4640947.1 transcription antitermination factor NusB [Deltaproteobacteria bacterium]MBT6501834.1 transcription antitermination factor NusB [Deltaproteobacteria bacterium]MBT6615894.1 transcription antitermination factor NusB [Deltaproteobacteria bacterium]